MDKPIEVNASATTTTTGTVIRYVLVYVAGVAVAKNVLPADTDINQLVSAIVAVASTAYGAYLAWKNHQQKKTMAMHVTNTVAKIVR